MVWLPQPAPPTHGAVEIGRMVPRPDVPELMAQSSTSPPPLQTQGESGGEDVATAQGPHQEEG